MKETRVRDTASKAEKRKDWGGVARKGAVWVDRDGPSTYEEPERRSTKSSSDKWVQENVPVERVGGKQRNRVKVDLSDVAVKEVTRLAGGQAPRMLRYLEQAAAAYAAERWRDAERAMGPLVDNVPDAPVVAELLGLIEYRMGKWAKALVNLERARGVTHSDQLIPAIMDCYRARKSYEKVEELWAELRDASPDAETMADGRIVAASAIAESGDIDRAIHLLEKAPKVKAKAKEHHLRIWYVLADLYERAGDVARARQIFKQVADHDPELADVLDRINALG